MSTLPNAESAFLAVAEAARVAIVTTDAQGRFTYANAAAERMLGATREQLRGVSSTRYVAPRERERFLKGLGKFLAGQGRLAAGTPVPFVGRRHSGDEFPAEITLSWFDVGGGRYVTGVVVALPRSRTVMRAGVSTPCGGDTTTTRPSVSTTTRSPEASPRTWISRQVLS